MGIGKGETLRRYIPILSLCSCPLLLSPEPGALASWPYPSPGFFCTRTVRVYNGGMQWQPSAPPFRALLAALRSEVSPVYVVGGVVRDALLGRAKPDGSTRGDLDIVLGHSAIPIARRVADRLGWAFYALDEGRDVARVIFTAGAEPLVCDIARMRGDSIEGDLRARDFTVNALAFELLPRSAEVRLIDVTGGREDLERRQIRRVSAAGLADDPVRLLRAVRFCVELGFPIEEATRDQILRMPGAVQLASAERLRDEVWKGLAGDHPAAFVEQLRILGILSYVLREVAATDLVTQSAPHDKDVYHHTLVAVQVAAALRDWLLGRRAHAPLEPGLEARLQVALNALDTWAWYLRQHFSPAVASGHARAEWLVWHALMHDVGKPATRTVELMPGGDERMRFLGHEDVGMPMVRARLEALKFSRIECDLCAAVVRNHMRPHLLHESFRGAGSQPAEISRRARYRFFRDVGSREVDRPAGVDVLMLALADRLAINDQLSDGDWRAYLVHVAQLLAFVYSEKGVETGALRPLLDGRLLMRELALQPGPRVGELLEQIAEAQAAGEIGSAEDALDLARRLNGLLESRDSM